MFLNSGDLISRSGLEAYLRVHHNSQVPVVVANYAYYSNVFDVDLAYETSELVDSSFVGLLRPGVAMYASTNPYSPVNGWLNAILVRILPVSSP